MPIQIKWCLAEDSLHAQNRQAYALAEKSVRIGFTFADAVKNVRKRLHHKNRDYLLVTRDHKSAVEYVAKAFHIAQLFNLTRCILSRGVDHLSVPRLNSRGKPSAFTDDLKIGYIKFDNGSRILAFSAHPQAMAVYGGDVGLDEFAKHPRADLLWETAQGRITWGYDIAIWSAHNGENTLFNQFAREARASSGPWNLYYRITITDAIDLGLLDFINKTRGTNFSRDTFVADCRARARSEEIFQQAYMCNPLGDLAEKIVDWSVLQRCQADYPIERLHLEAHEITTLFGLVSPQTEPSRALQIRDFLKSKFPLYFNPQSPKPVRLGFDVAASGQGDLTAIYIDELRGPDLWLAALFTCRTEDWHFIKSALAAFLQARPNSQAAGDETGLGRQICWETAARFPGRFTPVNFISAKQDLGFALMNQLSGLQKRFPAAHPDIAHDLFALRKTFIGKRWVFTESTNHLNPNSHCDIAWAAALASHAHTQTSRTPGARVG